MINLAIVDDHIMFAEGLQQLLGTYPEIRITQVAKNGAVFIRQLKGTHLKPHVILMDIEMPLMNGYETTREVLKILPSCKILYMTTHSSNEFIEQAITSKAHGFIHKSSDIETLLNAILNVHLKGYYFNEYFTYANLLKLLPEAPKFKVNLPEPADLKFTAKEIQVIRLLCEEKTDPEIAEILNISIHTAESYRKELMKKVKARKAIGVVVYALRKNLI
ncbi:MAG: response regulator [Bacteroidota bacterium]